MLNCIVFLLLFSGKPCELANSFFGNPGNGPRDAFFPFVANLNCVHRFLCMQKSKHWLSHIASSLLRV